MKMKSFAFIYIVPFFLFLLFTTLAFPLSVQTAVPKSSLNTIIIDAGHGFPDPGAHGGYSVEANIALSFALHLGERIKKEFPDIKIVYTRLDSNLPQGLKQSQLANRARADMANEQKGDLFISLHADAEPKKYKRIFKGYQNVVVYVKDNKTGKKIKQIRRKAIYQRIPLPHTITGSSIYIIAAHKERDKYKTITSNSDIFFGEDEDSPDANSPEMLAFAAMYSKRFFRKSYLLASLIDEEFKKKNRVTFGVKQRSKGIWVLQATSMPSVLIETGYICTPEDEKLLNSKEGKQMLVDAIIKALKSYRMLIDRGQYTIPKELLAVNSPNFTSNPAPLPEPIVKIDSVLPKIVVNGGKLRITVLNNIDSDGSLFSIKSGVTPLLTEKTISHTVTRSFNLFLPPNNSFKFILSAEQLKEIDAGHLEVTISDGIKDTTLTLFIEENKNVVIPIARP